MNKKEKDNIVGVMAAVAFAGFCLGAGLANHCYHFRGVTKMIRKRLKTYRKRLKMT